MRQSKLQDRGVVALVAIVLVGFFTAVAFALIDPEPREIRVNGIFQVP